MISRISRDPARLATWIAPNWRQPDFSTVQPRVFDPGLRVRARAGPGRRDRGLGLARAGAGARAGRRALRRGVVLMTAPVVYLVHLETKLGNPTSPHGMAGHYLGTTVDLNRRLAQHRDGTGARMLAAANRLGISYDVVRTWPGGRDVERQLKRQRNAPRLYPTCVPPREVT